MSNTRVTLTYDQWYALFRPFEDNEGLLVEIVDETAIVTLHAERKLWTEDWHDNISVGIHPVNKLRYLATIVPYPKDVTVYVREEGDSPHPIYFAQWRDSNHGDVMKDSTGLPYVFWSIRDGVEWMTETQKREDRWCFIDQEGQRYNWDGTEVHEDES